MEHKKVQPACVFADLCCPGNRCRDFSFLHFFSPSRSPSRHYPYRSPPQLPTPPLHYTPLHAAAACFAVSSPTTCRIVQSHTGVTTRTHTHTYTYTLCTHFPIYCSHFTMSQDRVTESSATQPHTRKQHEECDQR